MNISKTLRGIAASAAAISLAVSILGLLTMHGRFDELANSQRAGPLWHSAQLQTELMRFEQTLLLFAAGDSDVTSDQVRFRFDILWSRVPVVENSLDSVHIKNNTASEILDEISALLLKLDDQIMTLADGHAAGAMMVFNQLNAMEGRINEFTIDVKEIQARLDSATRVEFVDLADETVFLSLIMGLASLSSVGLFFMVALRHRKSSLQNMELAEKAQSAYQAKSNFISTVNHELRTPLTSIRGALAILERSLGDQFPENLRRVVSIANRNSLRLERLINDVLDFEKLEVGLSYDLQTVDIRSCVTDAVTANRSYNEHSNCNIVVEVPSDPVMIKADEGRIVQLMSNLISNAIKFSNDGGDVVVSLKQDKMAEIRVKDLGVGIVPEFRDKVFERFSQADSTVTRKYGGSGLGMSISKAIVEAHDGNIRFDSEVGVGTTFIVELPLLDQSPKVVTKDVEDNNVFEDLPMRKMAESV